MSRLRPHPWLLPWAGGAIGTAGGFLLWWFRSFLPQEGAAALALGLMTAITLGKWERELAPGRRLAGASAVALLMLVRWRAFSALPADPVASAAAAGALSRAVYVAAAWITRPAQEGAQFARGLDSIQAVAAIAAAVPVLALLPFRLAWTFCAASILLVFTARRIGERRGGLNDAGLACTAATAETLMWVVASCRSCMW